MEATRANNETARLLYVAATRAIRKLHLVAAVKRNNDTITPAKQSLLELLWPSVGAEFIQAEPIRLAEDTTSLAEFTPQLKRLGVAQVPATLASQHASKHSNIALTQPATPDAITVSTLAADKGTLAHLYMQLISNSGVAHWPASRLEHCKPAMIGWLLQQGHAQPLCVATADDITRILRTTLMSEDGQWVLKTRENEANELAIEMLDQQVIQKKVIDRTFVEDGTRWIIDYKSVDLDTGLAASALQAVAEQYREQLEAYAQLFAYEGLSVQKAVLFLSVGKLVKLT